MGYGGAANSNSSISGATDVSLSNPTTNQYLGFNGTTAKWENIALTGQTALASGGGLETLWANYSDSGAITVDLANGNGFRITLVGNATFTFTGAVNGSICGFTLYLKKNSGTETVTWPSNVWWPGGQVPTLSSSAGAYDVLVFESITGGAEWYGALVGADFRPAV